MQSSQSYSLLWPEGTMPVQAGAALDPQCVRDLELESTLAALTAGRPRQAAIRKVLLNLCTDPVVIAYRQEVLDDLWQNPEFTSQLEALLPDLSTLELSHISVDRRRSPLQEVAWRLGELEYLVNCVNGLNRLFAEVGHDIHAAGWHDLREHMAQVVRDPVYQQLTRELPNLLRSLRANVSVTIGVNLDEQFRPVAATLLSVNAQKYTSSTFLDRLLGNAGDDFKGLGPLHTVPDLPPGHGPSRNRGSNRDVNPFMDPLFRDLGEVLDSVCQPIAQALRHVEWREIRGTGWGWAWSA